MRHRRIFFIGACAGMFFLASAALAQGDTFGVGRVGQSIGLGGEDIRIIAAKIIRAILGVLGLIAVVITLYGGFVWMTAGGDEEEIGRAKKILVNGLIGTAILLASFSITQFVIGNLSAATGGGIVSDGSGGDGTLFCDTHPFDPSCSDAVCRDNPSLAFCRDRVMYVKSITPSTPAGGADPRMRNITIRALMSRPLAGDTDLSNALSVTKDGQVQPFRVRVTEGNYVLEALYSGLPEGASDVPQVAADSPLKAGMTFNRFQVYVISLDPHLAAGNYSVEFPNGATAGEARLLKDGQTLSLHKYNWRTSLSAVQHYTFSFTGFLSVEVGMRVGDQGTANLFDAPRLIFANRPIQVTGPFVQLDQNALVPLPPGTYRVEVNAGLKDESGQTIRPDYTFGGQSYPLTASFTVGPAQEDKSAPIMYPVRVNGAAGPAKVFIGDTLVIQSLVQDVTPAHQYGGAGLVYLDMTEKDAPIGTPPSLRRYYSAPPVSAGSAPDFAFEMRSIVDAASFTPQKTYNVTLTAYDVDGNVATGLTEFTVYGAHCNNAVRDVNLGETGIDAGGACGVPEGGACQNNAQCSGWQKCLTNICTRVPVILNVSPWNGASGNWVTILGKNFGFQRGSVSFGRVGDDGRTPLEWTNVSLAQCVNASWADEWIIVEVPDTAWEKSAVRVETAARAPDGSILSDTTTDAFGPQPRDLVPAERSVFEGLFTKNAARRPGLCSVTGDGAQDIRGIHVQDGATAAPGGTVVKATGVNLGNGTNSAIKFGGTVDRVSGLLSGGVQASLRGAWSADVVRAVVPENMQAGTVAVYADVNGVPTNGVPFTATTDTDVSRRVPVVESVDPANPTDHSYVTIRGRNFGATLNAVYAVTRPGVSCTNDDIDNAVCILLRVQLPAACGATWTDMQIIAEVADATGVRLAHRAYGIVVKNGNQQVSDGTAQMTIVDGSAKPGICAISPSSGPSPLPDGAPAIRIVGTGFRGDPTLYFWQNGATENNLATWLSATKETPVRSGGKIPVIERTGDSEILTRLPVGQNGSSMQTGPIKAQVFGETSNGVSYAVRDCTAMQVNEIPAGFRCCPSDKTLRDERVMCPGEARDAGYVWRFTTGRVPEVPSVAESCQKGPWRTSDAFIDFPSPTPWRGHEGTMLACLNAMVAVRFAPATVTMDDATINANTVKMFACGEGGEPDCSPLKKQAAPASDLVIRYDAGANLLLVRGVVSDLLPNTWYRVELSDRIQSVSLVHEAGKEVVKHTPLAKSRPCGEGTAYCWDFKTDGPNTRCSLADASIAPPSYTARRLGPLTAPPDSDNPFYFELWGRSDRVCQVVDADLNWQWSTRGPRQNAAVVTRDNNNPSRATADALSATAPEFAQIHAEAEDLTGRLVDADSRLMVDLGIPRVIDYWPNCGEACVNASIGMRFSQQMMPDSYRGNVFLFKCANELCEENRLTGPLAIAPAQDGDAALLSYTMRAQNGFSVNTWYLVKVTEGVKSVGQIDRSGNPLRSGVSVVPFAWKFRTRTDGAACTVEAVALEPSLAVARKIGDKTVYRATPRSAPDACSASGQTLSSWDYGWRWTTGDQTIATVSSFASRGRGAPFCSQTCVPSGSTFPAVVTPPPLCGNGQIDAGEDCDLGIVGETAGVSCTTECLRPGSTAATCGNGRVEPTHGEECDLGGNKAGWKTCTSSCTNAGAPAERSSDPNTPWCGSGSVVAGKDCDINDPRTKDGCSQSCLHVGVRTLSQAWCDRNPGVAACANAASFCGNRVVESGETCEAIDGSTLLLRATREGKVAQFSIQNAFSHCSSSCLLQDICGSEFAKLPLVSAGGIRCATGSEGCTAQCTPAGSSVLYSSPSLCGDSSAGIGEFAWCEAHVSSLPSLGQNPIQIASAVGQGTVNPSNGLQETTVNAQVQSMRKPDGAIDRNISKPIGSGSFALQCGYAEYATPKVVGGLPSYNDCPSGGDRGELGVGANSCCYKRPRRIAEYPSDGAGLSGTQSSASYFSSSLRMLFRETAETTSTARFAAVTAAVSLRTSAEILTGVFHDTEDALRAQVSGGQNQEPQGTARIEDAIRPAVTEAGKRQAMTLFANAVRVFLRDVNTIGGELSEADTSSRAAFRQSVVTVLAAFAPVYDALNVNPTDELNRMRADMDRLRDEAARTQYAVLDPGIVDAFDAVSRSATRLNETVSAWTSPADVTPKVMAVVDQLMATLSDNAFSEEVEQGGAGIVSLPDSLLFPISPSWDAVESRYANVFSLGAPVCPNTAIAVTLSGAIDPSTLQNHVQIARGYPSGYACAGGETNVTTGVQSGLARADIEGLPWWKRAWRRMTFFVARVFGDEANASAFRIGTVGVWCAGSIEAVPTLSYETSATGDRTTRMTLALPRMLDMNAPYAIVFKGGKNGVKDLRGVGLRAKDTAKTLDDVWLFATGSRVCKIDRVSVTPSSHLFTAPNTSTLFTAFAESDDGFLSPVPGVYDWAWEWGPANHPVFAIPKNGTQADRSSVEISSRGVEGAAAGIVSARVIADQAAGTDNQLGRAFTATMDLTAKFCEHPWPDRAHFPYADSVFNFSMGYCADAGASGSIADDLPYLSYPGTALSDIKPEDGELQKLLFTDASGITNDAVGLRIFANPERLSPREWHRRHFPNAAAAARDARVGGYAAVTDGSTYYVNVLNRGNAGDIYNNIFILSVNADAGAPMRQVFDAIIDSLKFNTDLTDIGYCLQIGGDIRQNPSVPIDGAQACTTDFDCRDAAGLPLSGLSGVCSNAKTKFLRDWQRLQDIRSLQSSLESYKSANSSYPPLSAGTFIPNYTAGFWPSWSRELGGALKRTLPQDPVNRKATCGDSSADTATCWNSITSEYVCPAYMSAYEYEAKPDTGQYLLHGNLEFFTMNDAVVREFISSNQFTPTPWCLPETRHSPIGARCGDGVVNPGEQCDPPKSTRLGSYGITGQGLTPGRCTDGYVSNKNAACAVDGDCGYYVVTKDRIFYSDARSACTFRGGVLYNRDVQDVTRGTAQELYAFGCANRDACLSLASSGQHIGVYPDASGGKTNLRDDMASRQNDIACTPLASINNFVREDKVACVGAKGTPIYGQCSAPALTAVATCGATCQFEYGMCRSLAQCGNGRVETGELCDDAGLNGTYGHCDAGCQSFGSAGRCGNGKVDGDTNGDNVKNGTEVWKELCDVWLDGPWTSYNVAKDKSCSWDCQHTGGYCGDEIVQTPQEACDDGNRTNGDGCSDICVREAEASAPVATPVSPPGSCGDGIVQSGPNRDGVTEACDRGGENGIRCAPEYGKSCAYCSADCRNVLTVDAIAKCGNGQIDEIGKNKDGTSRYEACDATASGSIVSSTPNNTPSFASNVQCSGLGSNYRGSYACNATCTALLNNCVACRTIENGGAAPKLAVLNVLTPKPNGLNSVWGRNTWRALYVSGEPDEPVGRLNWDQDLATDFRDYTRPQWILGYPNATDSDPSHDAIAFSTGIQTNPVCRDAYAVAFNEDAYNGGGAPFPSHGSVFAYPVNGEQSVVENELALSPAVRSGDMRIVVRWPNNETHMSLAGVLYNQAMNSGLQVDLTEALAKSSAENRNYVCSLMALANSYWAPVECQRFDDRVYVHDTGSLRTLSAQAMTVTPSRFQIGGNSEPFPYAFFVKGLSAPMGAYRNEDIVVEVYTGKPSGLINSVYGIYKPDYTFSIRSAGGSSNPTARYWHVFNIAEDPATGVYRLEFVRDNLSGPPLANGSIESGFQDVKCNVPGEVCDRAGGE